MGKLKALKEKRATIYTSIDELRQATDGREMTAEEQQRWDTMLSDYDKADKAVEAEERFVDIQRKQAEQEVAKRDFYIGDLLGEQYRKAFADYILNGASGISP
jgi:translation elongation factor EF-Tu-like GTPase